MLAETSKSFWEVAEKCPTLEDDLEEENQNNDQGENDHGDEEDGHEHILLGNTSLLEELVHTKSVGDFIVERILCLTSHKARCGICSCFLCNLSNVASCTSSKVVDGVLHRLPDNKTSREGESAGK